MRLINVHTCKFEQFFGGDDIPQYAVLSHTWGDEEVTFDEFHKDLRHVQKKLGFKKIQYCIAEARKWRMDYCWYVRHIDSPEDHHG